MLEDFKTKHPIEKRLYECSKIKLKYPTKAPTIIQPLNVDVKDIDRKKFLINREMEVAKVFSMIRARIGLNQSESMFIFIGRKTLLAMSQLTIGEIYDQYADPDGFLYLYYSMESTFG